MKKIKKLKGFTLIELIIVMAIFSLIMFTAMQLMTPVGKQFTNTAQYEGARSTLDNVKRYLDGTIRYADKVYVYRGDTYDINTEVQTFYSDLLSNSASNNVNQIYVLEFKNSNFDTGNNLINLYSYPVSPSGVGTGTNLGCPINNELFDEYQLKFCLGQYEYKYNSYIDSLEFTPINANVDVSEFCITSDIYKKNKSSPSVALNQCAPMAVSFINVNNAKAVHDIKYTETNGTTSYFEETNPSSNFKYVTDPSATLKIDDNFFIIYTLPEKY